jgi:hypothetical protein
MKTNLIGIIAAISLSSCVSRPFRISECIDLNSKKYDQIATLTHENSENFMNIGNVELISKGKKFAYIQVGNTRTQIELNGGCRSFDQQTQVTVIYERRNQADKAYVRIGVNHL